QAPKSRTETKQPVQLWIILAGAGVAVVILVFGLWWMFRGPSDRGAIEGEVTLDGLPMDGGIIFFTPVDGPKSISPSAEIKGGRYRLRAWDGPALGKNKVRILGGESVMVAPRYGGTDTPFSVDIKLG